MYKERKSYGGNDNGGFRGAPRGGGFAPVKVGQELDVKIEAVGQKGDGIAKEKGFVLFIPGAKENEQVRVKVTKVLRNVGFAEVIGKAGEGAEPKEAETQDSESFGEETESSEESTEENQDEEESSDDNYEDSENFGDEEKQ
jgi:predicted RNA-binding protein with TRAM domain